MTQETRTERSPANQGVASLVSQEAVVCSFDDSQSTSGRGRAHRHNTPKTKVELANAGRFAAVERRQQKAGSALVERRAPYRSIFLLGVEPIAAPLPDISAHVIDSEPIGSVATHLGRKSGTVGIAVDLHWVVRIPTVPFA